MRILIFTRYMPPGVSGGARRPYLLAKGLAQLGVEVRVVAPRLPEDIKGLEIMHPAPEPIVSSNGHKPGVRDWVRANLLLPDPDLRWSLRAARAAPQMEDFTPDWVLSTSPPESLHLAASGYAHDQKARWAADLRDSWLDDPLLQERRGAVRHTIERQLARHILKSADLLLAPTQVILDEAARLAPGRQLLLLPQPGPDPVSLCPAVRTRAGDQIVILHTGSFSFSHDARSIEPTLDLFRNVYARDKRFRLELVGRLTDSESAAAREVEGVEVRGLLPLQETWAEQAGADILLLVAASETDAEPGKLAEYRAMGKPIVCLGGGAWRNTLAGTARDPFELVLSLADEGARRALAEQQSARFLTGMEAAEMLLEALKRADNAAQFSPRR